jgi:putative transposase
MSKHSYNKIWIHFIWETPNKEKILLKEARKQISNFLYNYCKEKGIFMKINFVNADHVHALIDLPTDMSAEECIKLLKGASSFYINKNRITRNKFSWGKGYGAFSVSASQLNNVMDYIRNQEKHHRVKSFAEEYQLFIKNYRINVNENDMQNR